MAKRRLEQFRELGEPEFGEYPTHSAENAEWMGQRNLL